LAISIDGADAATHDANRGVVGSFQRSLDILQDAKELGVETQINTTLTPANFHQIEAMANQFAEFDIALWSVFFLIPVGRATEMRRLNADECEQAFERLWAESIRQPYMVKTTEAPHYRRFVMQQRAIQKRAIQKRAIQKTPGNSQQAPVARPAFIPAGVNDGKGVMFVSHTGAIYPTGFLPISCGVFPMQSVVSVYQDSAIFRSLRDADRLQGKCGQCEFRHLCGGSRARAFGVTGDLFAEEPDCSYIPTGIPS
jgi:radical SAM protein with 4Fe4S-binding SPASM domain